MEQQEPLHVDRHRAAFNFTLILALVLAVFGIITADPLLTVVGLGFAAWAWFTTPNTYALFGDRLVIAYGRPRLRVIPYGQVDHVELIQVPLGGPRVRVLRRNGGNAWLMPRDVETFKDRFDKALESFRGGYGGGDDQPAG